MYAVRGLSLGSAPGWCCVARSFYMLSCILPTGAGPVCARVNDIEAGAHFFFHWPWTSSPLQRGWFIRLLLRPSHVRLFVEWGFAFCSGASACPLAARMAVHILNGAWLADWKGRGVVLQS